MATPSMREGREAAEESISCLPLRQSLHPSCICPRPGASAWRWPPSAPRPLLPHCHIVSCCLLPHSPSCLGGQKGSSCPQKSSLQPWRLGLPVVVEKGSGDRQAGSLSPVPRARAPIQLGDLSKTGDSSKPSFPCLFSMDNRIRRRKKSACVWHIATSVQYSSVTTRAGTLGLSIPQLPKAQRGSTEALSIYPSYPEILIYKWLLLALWGHSFIEIAGQG